MIEANISLIDSYEGVNFIELSNALQKFYMLSLNTHENVKTNQQVVLSFKSNDCFISKEKLKNSFINELHAKIIEIFEGKIITILRMQNNFCTFEAQINTKAFTDMNLQVNDFIYTYINPSALFIKKFIC
ncbi:hypothetical protein [Campylobacter insulaenigrae]|uniref:hypothetical protein n=1 Tax=Campylobacter insulaenigrae TaxID=260714 RepID=UPI002152681A|nr:hypothetical protein [Campylobacter insulaenigrae]MCR6594794.1 hypothetical protein [Campylobacter insulaenigrae]